MLAAYSGEAVDVVPVAPEFWYYLPARVLGIDQIQLAREVPHWKALQETFNYYGTEGWGIVFPSIPHDATALSNSFKKRDDGTYEEITSLKTDGANLISRTIFEKMNPPWLVERPVKDFLREWPAYEKYVLGDISRAEWKPVNEALDSVGEDYLLELYLGEPFFDYVAQACDGGFQQGIENFLLHEGFLQDIYERHLAYKRILAREAFRNSKIESVCIGCVWSCLSLLGADLWRKWDKPYIQSITREVHELGGLVHIHFHGRCMDMIDDLADLEVDCICPWERPPGGDVTDLGEVRRRLRDKTTINGNVHTVETLIKGTPDVVRAEVAEILQQWGTNRRLIIGTGDQVGSETPDENIFAMVEEARRLGSH
jgi:hypothetical protein